MSDNIGDFVKRIQALEADIEARGSKTAPATVAGRL
jgi:hypothetical protein